MTRLLIHVTDVEIMTCQIMTKSHLLQNSLKVKIYFAVFIDHRVHKNGKSIKKINRIPMINREN